LEIAKLLEREGYLKNIAKKGKKVKKYLYCEIIYNDKKAKINDVARVSKQSRRIYAKASELKPVRQGYGIAVISTPKGLMTEKEAKKQKVGGEHLFNIW
ncbi:MAG: 30S ribosomal protein S8, partial [Candidatus Paceibacterota bacterium]